VTPLLTATCSSFPPDPSPSLSAVSMSRLGGRSIVTRLTQRFKALARRIVEAPESTGMFGLSTRKCGSPSPVRRGTSPASTASRLTLPSGRDGSAPTPLQYYLRDRSHFNPRPTASTTRRSQRTRLAGSPLIQYISTLLRAAH